MLMCMYANKSVYIYIYICLCMCIARAGVESKDRRLKLLPQCDQEQLGGTHLT